MNIARKKWSRVFDLGERRLIAVTVHPDGVVDFREKGRRLKYSAHLRSLLTVALRNFADDEKRRKKEERAARRAARD